MTTKAQPERYWYVSNPTSGKIECALNLEQKALRMQRVKLLEQVQLEGGAGLDRRVVGNGS